MHFVVVTGRLDRKKGAGYRRFLSATFRMRSFSIKDIDDISLIMQLLSKERRVSSLLFPRDLIYLPSLGIRFLFDNLSIQYFSDDRFVGLPRRVSSAWKFQSRNLDLSPWRRHSFQLSHLQLYLYCLPGFGEVTYLDRLFSLQPFTRIWEYI